MIETTRVWNEDGIKTTRPAHGAKSINFQVEQILDHPKLRSKPKLAVILADDGVFEGGTMWEVASVFMDRGVEISHVRAGIARKEGKIELGEKLSAVNPHIVFYCQEEVGDRGLKEWLCERDFFVGFPRSGRTHRFSSAERNIYEIETGVPYLHGWLGSSSARLNNGRYRFGERLTSISIDFWAAVEKMNGEILVRDLPRFPGPRPHPSVEVLDMNAIRYLETIERLVFGPDNKLKRDSSPRLLPLV